MSLPVNSAMAHPFSRSMRSLSPPRLGGSLWLLITAFLILGVWTGWAITAKIQIYETSIEARIETEYASHPIEAPVAGRVVANHLVMGHQVQSGEVLVELDAETERLQLREKKTEPTALYAQIEGIRNEIDSEERALKETRETAIKIIDEARTQLREATASEQFARMEAERLSTLYKGGFVSELDYLKAKARAEEQAAIVERARIYTGRVEQERRATEHDREATIARLKGAQRKAESELLTGKETIRRIEHEVEKRQISAPTHGWIGEVGNFPVGVFIGQGTVLGTIVPGGAFRMVAYFTPQAAMGRIQPGQPASIKLAGFPWSEYGTLKAIVKVVAAETSAGRVRVELDLSPNQQTQIRLQHGLPGSVEVEVTRTSPLRLLLRYLEL